MLCFRIYVHYYFHLFVWFFFSFYFITTCSWYFSYNIVNKMFDFFSPPSKYWNDRKKVSGGTQKTGFKLYGVSPKLFGLNLPVPPPFHLSLTFFTDYPKIQPQLTPLQMHLLRKKKFFYFFFYCSAFNIRH